MTQQHTLVIDGASYQICLPDAETDYIQKKIATEKQPYELAMLRDMASRLQPGDTVLDVGANVGNHTLYLANVCGALVHAFEPNAHLCDAIKTSAEWNRKKINVHQVGVAAVGGVARFEHLDPSNLGAQSLSVVSAGADAAESFIPLVALDDLDWEDPVKMIKVDVEGMELQVLAGAAQLLQRDKPILYIESQTAADFSLIKNLLKEYGYIYCSTFNSTPTHAFIHNQSLSLIDDVSEFLAEKANFRYSHMQEVSELKSKLQDCNLKYREANERIKQISEQKDQAAAKYRDATAQIATLKTDIEQARLQQQKLELEGLRLSAAQTLESERALLKLEQEKNAKDAELTEWLLQKQFADKEISLLQSTITNIQQQLADVKTELVEKTEKLKSADEKYRKVTSEQVPALKEQLAEQKSQVAILKQAGEISRQQIQALAEQYERLEQQLAESQACLLKSKEDYANVQSEKIQADLQVAEITSQLQQARQHLQDAQITLAERNEELQQVNERYLQLTAQQIPELQAALESKQHEILTLQQVIDTANTQHSEAILHLQQQYLAEHQALTAQKAQAEQLEKALLVANEKYRNATGDIIPQLKSKLEAQAERSKELQQRATELNQQLKQALQEKSAAQRTLSALRSSSTFKAGAYIRAAKRSWKDAAKLPVRLLRLGKKHQSKSVGNLPIQTAVQHAVGFSTAEHNKHHAELQVSRLADKANRQVRMACIMDDFTYGSYAPECELHQLTPENWLNELEACQPEVLFIESAWRGKDELWGSKVGHCSQELQGIVAWCRKRNIPTLFWNKEDPVHFETFLTTAKLFDFVFTTDMDCIHRYKAALGHDHVYFLPFACQPQVNNPIEKYVRKDAFCFAGAYYVRYPERTRDLESFVQELPSYKPLDIYDRNYGKDDPNYQFPAEYQPHIVGTLPYSEIDKAYKGYRYAINLNSVKQSQTMFARRVYELLGSNTLTISNFSRGVRLLFGDLVITSDSGAEVRRRLQELEANNSIDRLRLAGLRKAMSEHTYADRMNYILEKITGLPRKVQLPAFTIVAVANNQSEANNLAEQVARQQQGCMSLDVQLVLVCGRQLPAKKAEQVLRQKGLAGHAITVKQVKDKTLQQLAGENRWVAGMLVCDYYGPNYLFDIALATRYSTAKVIGKGAYFSNQQDTPVLQKADYAYQMSVPLNARRSAIQPDLAANINAREWCKAMADWQYDIADGLAIDAYNYCENSGLTASEAVLQQVSDLNQQPGFNSGFSVHNLTEMAEAIQPMESELQHAPWLDGAQLAHALAGESYQWLNGHGLADSIGEQRVISLTRNDAISTQVQGPLLEITSTLPDGKHEYLYAKNDLPLESLRQQLPDVTSGSIPLHFQIDPGLNLSLVVLYLDKNKERLSHEILLPNRNVAMTPADGTHYVRLGLRVYAGGSSNIHRLVLGHLDLEPANILGQADVLLLTNHYPSYEDLYRNGFVHSRVKAYREHNTAVDVFRLRKDQPISWHEFQNMDVITGSQQALRRMLASGRYRHVLVHFLDPDMWDVLKEFIGSIKVTVWVHGAEVQPWWRREYNYQDDSELEKAKSESDIRLSFWKGLFSNLPDNLHFVFVSQYFADEVIEDVAIPLPHNHYQIIHNPVDTDLFSYQEKPAEQRKKILSIRPYASRKYANDLSVKAVLELSKESFFSELEFRFIGDGALFDEVLDPIKKFSNVIVERGFLAQTDIARMHKEYGVFLCPTRMDAQGVSKDEAMSSGLVVVTNGVTAIPEFIDAESGILAGSEDYLGMAKGIVAMYNDVEYFKTLSQAAAKRSRQQVDKSRIVAQELIIFSV